MRSNTVPGTENEDPALNAQDDPAGEPPTNWLGLRSDDFLKLMDDAVYQAADKLKLKAIVNKVASPIFNWAQRYSPHPLHFGIMCCALEMAASSAPDFDAERVGVIYRSSPRQTDILLVNGPVSRKLRPKLLTLFEQMPEPKWVICMGECSISGGPYWDSYSVVPGADTILPVDVYIPGCPVRPEALLHGFLQLQRKIMAERKDIFLNR